MAEKFCQKFGTGVHQLKIGKSFEKKGGNSVYHSIRYDFKPVSVDEERKGVLEVQDNKSVTVTLPHVDGMGQTNYKGNAKPANSKECILIIDHETGELTLERISNQIMVKKTRHEKAQNFNPGGATASSQEDLVMPSNPFQPKKDNEDLVFPSNPYQPKKDPEDLALPSNPYQPKKEADNPYQVRKEPDNPYQVRKEPENPYQVRKEPDNPYQVKKAPDNPYQVKKEPDNPYQVKKEPENPYAVRKVPDKSRSGQRTSTPGGAGGRTSNSRKKGSPGGGAGQFQNHLADLSPLHSAKSTPTRPSPIPTGQPVDSLGRPINSSDSSSNSSSGSESDDSDSDSGVPDSRKGSVPDSRKGQSMPSSGGGAADDSFSMPGDLTDLLQMPSSDSRPGTLPSARPPPKHHSSSQRSSAQPPPVPSNNGSMPSSLFGDLLGDDLDLSDSD